MSGALVKSIVGAGSAICLLFAPADSRACSFPGNSPHELDPDEIGLDQGPPSKVSVVEVHLERPDNAEGNCLGIGIVSLYIAPATDDRTDADHMGYVVSKVGDSWPEGFGFDYSGDPGPVRDDGTGVLFLHWSDMNDDNSRPLDFSFAISVVDLAGNQGPPSEPVHIYDPGSPSGCATSGFCGSSVAALGLCLFVLVFRSRRLRPGGQAWGGVATTQAHFPRITSSISSHKPHPPR